jgi:hypothetical protein
MILVETVPGIRGGWMKRALEYDIFDTLQWYSEQKEATLVLDPNTLAGSLLTPTTHWKDYI